MKAVAVKSGEQGFALIVAILCLLVMSALALVLMIGNTLNRGLAGNDQRMRQSLNIAEAGVGEATSRISHQDVAMDPLDPKDVCQIFNVVAGSVPVLGVDSTALATAQPAGAYLNYTTAGRSGDELTLAWKKNAAGTAVMRYDPAINPHVNTTSGVPIYVVSSTGRVGNVRRTIVSEVIQKPFTANIRAGLAASVPIQFLGNAYICGFNHSASTPDDDGKNGRALTMASPDPTHCLDNEIGGTNLPGAWSTGSVTGGGAAGASGSPAPFQENQAGFYAGPWDAIGMSAADYYAWVGPPTTSPPNYNGIVNYDNNATTQDQSSALALHSVSGEGMLYVDGDLTCNAGFTYRGLLYVEGDLKINGQAWVLGGVIVRGKTTLKANGGMTILYSADAITQALSKYGGQFVTLSWREK